MAKKKNKRKKKKRKPKYSNEEQIYNAACMLFVQSERTMRDNRLYDESQGNLERAEFARANIEVVDHPVVYELRTLHGKRVHLLGEEHGSRDPVDYTHEHLAPSIIADPDSWMILVEGAAHKSVLNKHQRGGDLYFRELAKTCGLPFEEALTDLVDDGTRGYIVMSGTENEVIDLVYVILHMKHLTPEELAYRESAVGRLANMTGFSRERVGLIFERLPIDGDEGLMIDWDALYDVFVSKIGRPWNRYIRQCLPDILGAHPERTNVLVNIGERHFDAYRE